VTQSGGTNYGGVVFRLGTAGSAYNVLYNFGIQIPPAYFNGDGLSPVALTQGADGVLYGVTRPAVPMASATCSGSEPTVQLSPFFTRSATLPTTARRRWAWHEATMVSGWRDAVRRQL